MKKLILLSITFTLSLSCLAKSNISPYNNQLCFIENMGQVTDQYGQPRKDIDYVVHCGGMNIFIGSGSLHYQWAKSEKKHPGAPANGTGRHSMPLPAAPIETYRMDVLLQGADKARPLATEMAAYYETWYGAGEDGIRANACKKITYKNIYPGTDWVIYIRHNRLEYEFAVSPAGNPAAIQVTYNGVGALSLNGDGSLTAATPMGHITEQAPVSYLAGGAPVAASFCIRDNTLRFNIAPYPAGNTLTIDPALDWATNYETTNALGAGVVCDTENGVPYVYMCGDTRAGSNVATVGAYQVTLAGTGDAFIVKFDSSGARQWATYYGGAGALEEAGMGLASDATHNLYMCGATGSALGIATQGSHQTVYGGGQDAYLVKFNSAGSRKWGTYYGAIGGEWATGVCVDPAGYVYMTGQTTSTSAISTPGSYKPVHTGSYSDAFLVKFDSLGVRQWGTYYGGTYEDWPYTVKADSAGGVYITGYTFSTDSIATAGSYQPAYGGGNSDAFLAKFANTGQLQWATYYGGADYDEGHNIACTGNYVYMSGFSNSLAGIATPGSYQPVAAGGYDAFVVKFNGQGQRQWGTYYGGPDDETAFECNAPLALDDSGNVFLAGTTYSTTGIATAGSYQPQKGGGITDIYLAKLRGNGAGRKWGTYYGGCGEDEVWACAADGFGNIYLAGYTASYTGMATAGSYEPIPDTNLWTNYLGYDMVLAKFKDIDQPGIMGDTLLCPGATAAYHIYPVLAAIGYQWLLPTGWTGASDSTSITATAGNSGMVAVVALKECSSDTMFIHVTDPVAHPIITQNGALLSTATFSSYQWYRDGAPLPTATNQAYTATQNGTYYVRVTLQGCSNNSDTVIVSGLNITTVAGGNDFYVYPNPVPKDGQFTIAAQGMARATIVIYDMSGRKVYEQQIGFSSGTAAIRTTLQAGMYVLQLTGDQGGRHFQKLTISR